MVRRYFNSMTDKIVNGKNYFQSKHKYISLHSLYYKSTRRYQPYPTA